MALDGDWKKALTVAEDGQVSIISLETCEQIIALDYNDKDAGPYPAFTSDGCFTLISDYDGHLLVFESETGECGYDLNAQESILQFILSNDMHTLYVLNDKGKMRTWRVEYFYGM